MSRSTLSKAKAGAETKTTSAFGMQREASFVTRPGRPEWKGLFFFGEEREKTKQEKEKKSHLVVQRNLSFSHCSSKSGCFILERGKNADVEATRARGNQHVCSVAASRHHHVDWRSKTHREKRPLLLVVVYFWFRLFDGRGHGVAAVCLHHERALFPAKH